MMIEEQTKNWLATRFGISPESILWFNSGICYDRVIVATKEDSQKVSEFVKDGTVNGGWFHGMPLGLQSNVNYDGKPAYEVMC